MISREEVLNRFLHIPEQGVLLYRFNCGRAKEGDVVGWISNEGYYKTKVRGMCYFVHQLIWLYEFGYIPKEIDHINGIRNDNRLENLREATRSQNLANGKFPAGESGLRGVKANPGRSTWRSTIGFGGQNYFLGNYGTKEEAAAVYKRAADIIYGEYALHNRPSEQENI